MEKIAVSECIENVQLFKGTQIFLRKRLNTIENFIHQKNINNNEIETYRHNTQFETKLSEKEANMCEEIISSEEIK